MTYPKKAAGNMYQWITHTFNPITGKCPYDCSYCYVKAISKRVKKGFGEFRLNRKALTADLKHGRKYFIGSSVDMWAAPDEWISSVLDMCICYPGNSYLFQTKNPLAFYDRKFPPDTLLGVTIETNRDTFSFSNAPPPEDRATAFAGFDAVKMISIEPVMDFDLVPLLDMIRFIAPLFVSIGADSKRNRLPEPSRSKISDLISGIAKMGVGVKLKQNIERLR